MDYKIRNDAFNNFGPALLVKDHPAALKNFSFDMTANLTL